MCSGSRIPTDSLGFLRSTASATDGATAATTWEASAGLSREATAATRAASEVVAAELLGTKLALLNLDLETIDRVRVRVDGSLECGRRLKVDKSTVLTDEH